MNPLAGCSWLHFSFCSSCQAYGDYPVNLQVARISFKITASLI
ncbi:hypothetical protein NC653_030947 [Populus alba x Populus x berolinensis]|uniref:Uncharacterized protein n=1 Tax=Populus alba x Populus x berolinensis TaxID=444605 RepID=A0AAD6LX75_9ROSI|nr:hypothetical protein NC653_030947 [Populus alba x Populus x berolinensis]